MKTKLIIAALISAVCLSAHGSTNSLVDRVQRQVKAGQFEEARQLIGNTLGSNSVAAIQNDFMRFLGRPFVQPQQIDRYIAKHSVSNSPAYWVMKLTQAEAYWAWGKTNDCTSICELFVKEFPKLIGIESEDEALTRAEKYVAEKKIDVSKHFVSSVRYVKSGAWTDSSIGKGPYWQVTYELVQRADGGQHFILVYMDGKVGHISGR